MDKPLVIFGQHDEATVKQMERCLLKDGKYGVLCADGHKGYAQPVGGVMAYENKISISGVGYDIGCGNLAVRTDADPNDVQANIETIMDDIFRKVSFGMGRKNQNPIYHSLFEDEAWKLPMIRPLKSLAQEQLGTVGSGNHYVDIFLDEEERVWVGVHFGSRGLGHKSATYFLEAAGGVEGMDVDPCVVAADSELGTHYLEAMRLAGLYAYAGREYVCDFVTREILRAHIIESVHNHHNYAWKEKHRGKEYWVVRKGATPAFPGQRGFVGGSMGDDAVIIEGTESPLSQKSLYSSVHGAGRVMSRTAAKGKSYFKKGRVVSTGGGLISREDMFDWLRKKKVSLRGGDVDEAPQAYRRLRDVLKAHEGTIKVIHTLRPIGVAMAGSNEFDPYKD